MNTNKIKIIGAKTVILGDTGVGKTSIALRFVNNSFMSYVDSTIGTSYLTKTITVNNDVFKFFIWDTAGQEKYHSLASMYYKNAVIAIIVYDITKKKSFENVKKWADELYHQGPFDIKIAIIGNKADLEIKREVSTKMVNDYAKEINAIFLETSAKDNLNIYNLFENLAKKIDINSKNIISDNIIHLKSSNKQINYTCC